MKTNKYFYILIYSFTIFSLLFAVSDTQTVSKEFERCFTVMESNGRALKRLEELINNLNQSIQKRSISSFEKQSAIKEISVLENKLEYFRKRFERSNGQADKIRGDLKNISGPVCPSCIESSVNLFCRTQENLQTDIEEYIIKAVEVGANLGLKDNKNYKDKQNELKDKYKKQLVSIDSLLRIYQHGFDTCSDHGAKTLISQVKINITRAESLYVCNNIESSLQSLNIAYSLIEKAIKRCCQKTNETQ